MIAQAVQMERTDERMSRMLYYNGTVITMEEPFCAQAVLTEDGVIRAVGTFEDVRAAAGEGKNAWWICRDIPCCPDLSIPTAILRLAPTPPCRWIWGRQNVLRM